VDQLLDARGSAVTQTPRERNSTCARTLGGWMLAAAVASCSSDAAQGGGITSLQSRITEFTIADAATADAAIGSLGVDASVTTVLDPTTVCPTIAAFAVTPSEAVVGTPMSVIASTDPSGATVTYTVATGDDARTGMGTPTPTRTGGTFTCTAPGQLELTATTTAPLANGAGSCPPQSISALITCDPAQIAAPALPRWALATLVALLLITAQLATRRDRERQA
jgi:hypothetical protein